MGGDGEVLGVVGLAGHDVEDAQWMDDIGKGLYSRRTAKGEWHMLYCFRMITLHVPKLLIVYGIIVPKLQIDFGT